LKLVAAALWAYQRSGLQRLVRRTGVLKRVSPRLSAMDELMPTVRFGQHRVDQMKTGSPRLRVGLLLGCVQRVFFAEVNAATARVLAAEGCEVVVPAVQGCCGALMTHAGEEAAAMEFARRMIDAFEDAKVDVVAINAAGCGSAMKEYGHLLRDDPKYAARAREFAAKCRDVSEVLAGLPARSERHPLPVRVAYHDACHLQHAQGIRSQPRELLRGIPGLGVVEIEDAAICCGSAGVYNLLQPEAARELGRQKVENVLNTGAVMVASGNPGCTLQIGSGLRARGSSVRVVHWIELLDASIRGEKPLPRPPLQHRRRETGVPKTSPI
jgi:glycolate oxidase iron-sulfur subunit